MPIGKLQPEPEPQKKKKGVYRRSTTVYSRTPPNDSPSKDKDKKKKKGR